VTSIHLDGLLFLRRILLRFGIASTIRKGAGPRVETFPNGHTSVGKQKYDLRFSNGAHLIGYSIDEQTRYAIRNVYAADGHVWSRVKSIEPTTQPTVFCPINTPTRDYITAFGRSHNC